MNTRMKARMKFFGFAPGWKGLLAGAVVTAGIGGCIAVVQPNQPVVYQQQPITYAQPAPVAPPEAPPAVSTPAVAPPADNPAVPKLDPLVAPIALYPDPVLAVTLPAATYQPDKLQEAADWTKANPQAQPAAIDGQQWAPEIRAVAHYPDALYLLVGDAAWTQSLGSAYSAQQADVMAAIQDMRSQATVENNLVSTPQQVVVNEGGVIAIQPANPQAIYIPAYDPVLVYTGYHPIVFGGPLVVGPWFVNGFDWEGGTVFVGDWYGPYYYHDGVWGWDHGWHESHFRELRHWEHDQRFGAAVHVDHYVNARGVEAHKSELSRSLHSTKAMRRSRFEQSAKAAGRTTHAGSTGTGHPAGSTGTGYHPGNTGTGQHPGNTPFHTVPDPKTVGPAKTPQKPPAGGQAKKPEERK